MITFLRLLQMSSTYVMEFIILKLQFDNILLRVTSALNVSQRRVEFQVYEFKNSHSPKVGFHSKD